MKSKQAKELTDEKFEKGLNIVSRDKTFRDVMFKEAMRDFAVREKGMGYSEIIKDLIIEMHRMTFPKNIREEEIYINKYYEAIGAGESYKERIKILKEAIMKLYDLEYGKDDNDENL
jgi:L-ribulose-5-phosphate 3-epimerase UlaE